MAGSEPPFLDLIRLVRNLGRVAHYSGSDPLRGENQYTLQTRHLRSAPGVGVVEGVSTFLDFFLVSS